MKWILKDVVLVSISAFILAAASGCAPGAAGSRLFKESASIIGGVESTGDEPFAKTVVALYDTSRRSLCTASILSDTILVTAAHCVEGEASNLVAIFNVDMRGSDLIVRRAMRTEQSPEWMDHQDDETDEGDIALVRFAGGLPQGFAPAKVIEDVSELKDGLDVLLAGYGISDGVNHTGARVLRSVITQISKADYSKTEVLVDQTHGKGACHGDSGGPAYVTINGELRLFGVTSRGVNDPNNDCSRFAAYTDIAAYKDWIATTSALLNAKERDTSPPIAAVPDASSPSRRGKKKSTGSTEFV